MLTGNVAKALYFKVTFHKCCNKILIRRMGKNLDFL